MSQLSVERVTHRYATHLNQQLGMTEGQTEKQVAIWLYKQLPKIHTHSINHSEKKHKEIKIYFESKK